MPSSSKVHIQGTHRHSVAKSPCGQYACRGNRVFCSTLQHVTAVAAAPVPAGTLALAPSAIASEALTVLPSALDTPWRQEHPAVWSFAGGPSLAAAAVSIAQFPLDTSRQLDPLAGSSLLDDFRGAQQRLDDSSDAIEDLRRRRARNDKSLRRLAKESKQRGSSSEDAVEQGVRALAQKAMRRREHAARLRAQAQAMQEQGGAAGVSWEMFEAMVQICEDFGALTATGAAHGPVRGHHAGEGWYSLEHIGRMARDMRFDNELWLALVLNQKEVIVRPPALRSLLAPCYLLKDRGFCKLAHAHPPAWHNVTQILLGMHDCPSPMHTRL